MHHSLSCHSLHNSSQVIDSFTIVDRFSRSGRLQKLCKTMLSDWWMINWYFLSRKWYLVPFRDFHWIMERNWLECNFKDSWNRYFGLNTFFLYKVCQGFGEVASVYILPVSVYTFSFQASPIFIYQFTKQMKTHQVNQIMKKTLLFSQAFQFKDKHHFWNRGSVFENRETSSPAEKYLAAK